MLYGVTITQYKISINRRKKKTIGSLKSPQYQSQRGLRGQSIQVSHAFLPPRLFLHDRVLIPFFASPVGLMARWIGPCQYVCRSVCDLETSQRKRCQCVLSRVLATPSHNSSPDSLQIKEHSEHLLSLPNLLSLFILSCSQIFLVVSHLSFCFKQTQRKRCRTRLLAESPFVYVLPYSSSTLVGVHGRAWLCERAVGSLSFYLNERAARQPVGL